MTTCCIPVCRTRLSICRTRLPVWRRVSHCSMYPIKKRPSSKIVSKICGELWCTERILYQTTTREMDDSKTIHGLIGTCMGEENVELYLESILAVIQQHPSLLALVRLCRSSMRVVLQSSLHQMRRSFLMIYPLVYQS
jgi:hypothetical protein